MIKIKDNKIQVQIISRRITTGAVSLCIPNVRWDSFFWVSLSNKIIWLHKESIQALLSQWTIFTYMKSGHLTPEVMFWQRIKQSKQQYTNKLSVTNQRMSPAIISPEVSVTSRD